MIGASRGNRHSAIVTILFSTAAMALFVPLFISRGIGPFDFWWWMSITLVVLIAAGILFDRDYVPHCIADISENPVRKIALGLAAAVLLFAVFTAGNLITRYIFDFSGRNIKAVYGFRGEASSLRITLLMAGIIGPGEELFWRVFLQRRLGLRLGDRIGFIAATAMYTAVHLASGNPILVLAALICGIFWGLLYLRFKSPLINIISHTVWDIAVFILFPFTE
jgi:uncharacterized protein